MPEAPALSSSPVPSLPPRGRRLLRFWCSPVMLTAGLAGFLAGFLVMWNVELQLLWLAVTCLPAVVAAPGGLTRDPVLRLAAVFLGWNLLTGLLRNPQALSVYYTWEFLAGSAALPVYLAAVWLVCRRPGAPRTLLITLTGASVAAALAGIAYWHFVQCPSLPGDRLRNPLVYGGLHPVPTAILLGFGVTAASALWLQARTAARRVSILAAIAVSTLAVMLTLSRGGLLVILAGMAALTLTAGWRRSWPPAAAALAAAAAFQLSASFLAPFDFHPPPPPGAGSTAETTLARLTDSPAREYLARADTGRRVFYKFGLSTIDTWDKILTGAGLWGPELELEKHPPFLNHFHSLFLATFIHGGLTGLALLGSLLAITLRRGWHLARNGQPEWITLLLAGLGGLLFDGQSACSLVTHTRFENLIFWFPVVAIAALRDRPAAPSSSRAAPVEQ